NENFVSVLIRRLEDALHILHGLVLCDALADERPRKPFLTQHLILWVDKYHGSVIPIDVHGYLPCFVRSRGRRRIRCCTAQEQATKPIRSISSGAPLSFMAAASRLEG